MEEYVKKLNPGGYLIMSGFYLKDLPLIQQKATELELTFKNHSEENQWVAASFYKN